MRFPFLALAALMCGKAAVAQVGPNIDELAKELANPGAANPPAPEVDTVTRTAILSLIER